MIHVYFLRGRIQLNPSLGAATPVIPAAQNPPVDGDAGAMAGPGVKSRDNSRKVLEALHMLGNLRTFLCFSITYAQQCNIIQP